MSKRLPIVAIVGRANVGKSSLFNAIIGHRESIVAKEAGTTRDAVWHIAQWQEQAFWLVDTAGMKAAEDDFELTIQEQIAQAAESADCILVVAEAGSPLSPEDRTVAKTILKAKKPVMLVVNKIDKLPSGDLSIYRKLGIKSIVATSVTQKKGFHELLDALVEELPQAEAPASESLVKVALLGRPNVGKSSLFNTAVQKQQAIVSSQAGTTRDINRQIVRYHGQAIQFLDTAGIRRSGKIERGIEQFSVLRSIAAIEEADIGILVLDSQDPAVQLDLKIAGMIKAANRGLIVVLTKWDLVEKDSFTRDQIAARLRRELDFIPWAPLVFTSSVSGQNVSKLLELIYEINQTRSTIIKTSELNRWLQRITERHQPAGLKNTHPRLRYMMQEADNPTNFKVYGSDTKFLHWSYKRYMERELRQAFGFSGTALRFWFFDGSEPSRKSARSRKQAQKE